MKKIIVTIKNREDETKVEVMGSSLTNQAAQVINPTAINDAAKISVISKSVFMSLIQK